MHQNYFTTINVNSDILVIFNFLERPLNIHRCVCSFNITIFFCQWHTIKTQTDHLERFCFFDTAKTDSIYTIRATRMLVSCNKLEIWGKA